jgi:transcriptional regulator with XRE-family HTH domain
MSIHLKIAEARKNKGLTQEEVADRASVTVRTIQRIESGETIPRNFTLKAIAEVLGIPFNELVYKDTPSPSPYISRDFETEDTVHFLQLLNLSCFTYIIIPYIHFLIPMYILRRRKELNMRVLITGRKMVQTQVIWVVALNLTLLLTVVYNLGFARNHRAYYIHYLWPTFLLYFLNAVIILVTHFRIKRNYYSSK